jgi:hypothetical protein
MYSVDVGFQNLLNSFLHRKPPEEEKTIRKESSVALVR